VANQNLGLPVKFKEKSIKEQEFIFENLDHDFPQTITYTRISADSLVAEISGIKDGEARRQRFPMKRLNP
jgi:hypothetical protein